MVAKPNLPDTRDGRPHPHRAARATPGLAALDEEREASMADEGGVSGAAMESEDVSGIAPHFVAPAVTRRGRAGVFFFGAAAGMIAVMAATSAIRRRVQNPQA